jgi:hypothetical protein
LSIFWLGQESIMVPKSPVGLYKLLPFHEKWLRGEEGGRRAAWPGANLRGAKLPRANLRDSDLAGVKLAGAVLTHASLRDANLASADLSGVNAANADLRNCNLHRARLSRSCFRHADLSHCNLTEADLSDCDLRFAVLEAALLPGASLQRARLEYADLRGIDLSGTDMKDCCLTGAFLQGARLPPDVVVELQPDVPGEDIKLLQGILPLTLDAQKSLLALLDTCVEWPEDAVSLRRLHDSPLLKEKRVSLGLPGYLSEGTVHNYLLRLATFCSVGKLLVTGPARRSSCFRPGIRETLREKVRPILADAIRRSGRA